MKNTKRRMELFAFYDYTGIQAHLEAMAAKGWMVEKLTTWYWQYRRMEPRALRFAVTYFPTASSFDAGPTEGQQVYQDYCAEAGWRPVTQWGQMQIFCHSDAEAVSLETDAAIQVDTIHQTMKRATLPGLLFVIALSVFELAFQLWQIAESPIRFFSQGSSLLMALVWLPMLPCSLYTLLFYFHWHKKAKALAEASGTVLPIRTRRRLSIAIIAVSVLCVAAGLLFSSRLFRFGILFGLVMVALVSLLTHAAASAMKSLRASRRVNRTVTLALCLVLTCALMGWMIALILQGTRQGWLDNHPPAATYEYMGMTWRVYRDPLPLRLEDLTDVDYDSWSTEFQRDESILLAHTEYSQQPRMDALDQPDLEYTVTEIKFPLLYEPCKRELLERYTGNVPDDILPEYLDRYKLQSAAPEGVTELYRLYTGDSPRNWYLFCWPDRLAEIRFDWAPTAEQLATAAERLRNA